MRKIRIRPTATAEKRLSRVLPVRSYRLVSADGETWSRDPAEAVLADSAPGSWDAGGIETPRWCFSTANFIFSIRGIR